MSAQPTAHVMDETAVGSWLHTNLCEELQRRNRLQVMQNPLPLEVWVLGDECGTFEGSTLEGDI